ncbi:MAG: hypothetical protein IJX94_00095 [Clostridia bacterium]|nr:hypothetical protein [Clostridia bacterium]
MNRPYPLIDFHSHILPGADHGSSGTKESLNQLEIIKAFGVDTVVATPHFYPNSANMDEFLQLVAFSAEKLSRREERSPRICLGAEVLYCAGLHQMDRLESLCIRGTNVLLLELPMDGWSEDLFYTVESLTRRFTVVLAHIDRYIHTQKAEIYELLRLGAFAQINGYAFDSFGKRRKLAPILESDRVVALGSDLHGTDKKTYQKFIDSKKRLGDTFDVIMERSAKLLESAEYLD